MHGVGILHIPNNNMMTYSLIKVLGNTSKNIDYDLYSIKNLVTT